MIKAEVFIKKMGVLSTLFFAKGLQKNFKLLILAFELFFNDSKRSCLYLSISSLIFIRHLQASTGEVIIFHYILYLILQLFLNNHV